MIDVKQLAQDLPALRKIVEEYLILKETVEHSPLHFAVYDRNDELVAWNPPYESNYPDAFAEFRARGATGRLHYADLVRSLLSRTLPPEEVEAEVARRIAYQRNCQGEESVRRYKDHWLRVHKYLLPSGAVAGLAVDVTALVEREAEMEAARAAAEAGERAKAEFLATMSHEIRTPMNGVVGLADVLKRTELDDAQARIVDAIVTSAEALLTIINDILDFSKLDADKMKLVIEPLELRAAIDDVVTLLSPTAQAKGLAVRRVGDAARAPWRLGDPQRLRQCLLNLIGNAIKFTEAGSVDVRIEEHGDDAVTVSVRDTGVGIPADRLDAVFAAFEQADSAATRRFQGTGLGLAITSRLVTLMGGEIGVTSQEGVGSTFAMRLPLARCPAPAAEPAPAPAATGDLSDLRLLLAEDNAVNRMVFEKLIESGGAALRVCDDGAAAVAAFKAQRPDLVFMDLSMPVMCGLSATAAIREHERREGLAPTPIIALTANAQGEDRDRCLQAGMSDHLAKPINRARLMAMIARWRPAVATQGAR